MNTTFNILGKSEARKNFLSILNGFTNGLSRPVLVTDHGKNQAVILPFQEYQFMQIKLSNYEKSQPKKAKKSIWGNSTEILVDLEKHNWNDVYDEWLKKWDDV